MFYEKNVLIMHFLVRKRLVLLQVVVSNDDVGVGARQGAPYFRR